MSCLSTGRDAVSSRSVVLCLCLASAAASAGTDDLAADVFRMTGARTRIVWAHQVKGDAKRWGSGSSEFELMGFDTAEGKPRVILPGPAGYGNPSLTPDGSRVVFTDTSDETIYAVDWDGANRTNLCKGFALCTWADPDTGLPWVYAANHEFGHPIVRFRLDDPATRETVWDKPCGPSSGFQVSADGTRAGCLKKHPGVGTVYFDEDRHATHGWGCEAGFAPDNSYRFFHMGEWVEHAGVNMYDADGANKRTVHFGRFPGSPGYDAWNPRWSTDVRFMTVSSPNAGPEQDVYLGVFDTGITRIERWIRISYGPGQDLGSHAWIDPGLGYHSGEAPLSIAVPGPGGGTWAWEFGDGTAAEGAVAKHTYEQPGSYTLAGRQGEQALKGHVVVTSNAPPVVLDVGLRDERTLQVWFDEPVVLDNAAATLKSGVKVEKVTRGHTQADIVLRLDGRIRQRDVLRLDGVFDRAARRNPVASTIPVRRSPWPADREGLLLLWGGGERDRFHFDPKAGKFLQTHLSPHRIARIDRQGGMQLRGGTFVARGAALGIPGACRASNAVSLEAVITPYGGSQGTTNAPRLIVGCQYAPGVTRANVALCQAGEEIHLYMYTKPKEGPAEVRSAYLCRPKARTWNHIVVTYAPGKLACYLNGKEQEDVGSIEGTLEWQPAPFHSGWIMGGEHSTEEPWWGGLERIAVFARALDRKEAAANYAEAREVLSARPDVPRVVVSAKLVAKSEIPSPDDIAPYTDALIVNEYEVVELLTGGYKPKRVRVAQWGLVDKQVAPIGKTAVGTGLELELERLADHPELDSESIRDSLDVEPDLEVYLDVTVWG